MGPASRPPVTRWLHHGRLHGSSATPHVDSALPSGARSQGGPVSGGPTSRRAAADRRCVSLVMMLSAPWLRLRKDVTSSRSDGSWRAENSTTGFVMDIRTAAPSIFLAALIRSQQSRCPGSWQHSGTHLVRLRCVLRCAWPVVLALSRPARPACAANSSPRSKRAWPHPTAPSSSADAPSLHSRAPVNGVAVLSAKRCRCHAHSAPQAFT
jgi:hypothetical protein